MSTQTDALERLRFAGARRAAAEDERQEAAVELRTRIHDAHAAGVTISLIAREAGLSRQAVYDVLKARRPS